MISLSVIKTIEDAGGMFLEKREDKKEYYVPLDRGKKISKTCQCLREGAPKLLASLQKQEEKTEPSSGPRSSSLRASSSRLKKLAPANRLKKKPPASSNASTPVRQAASPHSYSHSSAAPSPVSSHAAAAPASAPVIANMQMVRQAENIQRQEANGSPHMSFSASRSHVSSLSRFSWRSRAQGMQANGGGSRTFFDRRDSISSSGSGQAR